MHCDNRLHVNEQISINEIGIRMGLSLDAMHKVMEIVATSKDSSLPIDDLVSVYKLQHN